MTSKKTLKRSFGFGRLHQMRLLMWLADVGGTATGRECQKAVGLKTGATKTLYAMQSYGWVTLNERPRPAGSNKRNYWSSVCNGTVELTTAGFLWADYMRWEPHWILLDKVEMHTRIRALEFALEWMMGQPTETQRRMARDILEVPDNGRIIYPWSADAIVRAEQKRRIGQPAPEFRNEDYFRRDLAYGTHSPNWPRTADREPATGAQPEGDGSGPLASGGSGDARPVDGGVGRGARGVGAGEPRRSRGVARERAT